LIRGHGHYNWYQIHPSSAFYWIFFVFFYPLAIPFLTGVVTSANTVCAAGGHSDSGALAPPTDSQSAAATA